MLLYKEQPIKLKEVHPMNYKNNKLNRFSIRKYSVGVASVLIGFAFLGTPVLADQVTATDQESAPTVTVDVPKETVETATPTPEVLKEDAKATLPEVEVEKSASEAITEVATVKVETAVDKDSENVTVEKTEDVADKTIEPAPAEKTAIDTPEVKSAETEVPVAEKSTEATIPVTKKTVGYAAANVDRPETSIVNDVTRVRAVKKDGKYVRSTELAKPAEDGHTALYAAGNGSIARGDDYPQRFKAQGQSGIDDWRLYTCNCTSFVAYRLSSANHFELPPMYGDASVWDSHARNEGYQVDKNPALGSVAWWDYCHVAWVSNIIGSNVEIEEYNYNWSGAYNRRVVPISSVTGFIHFKDLAGGGNHTPSAPTPAPNQGTPSSGRYTFTGRASIKAEPKMSSPELAYYDAGQSVNYDRKLEADGHEWISYLSFAGHRRYIPIREIAKPQEAVVKGSINILNTDVVNGSFEVVINNVSSNKGIKTVSVPIWTERNGQDDIVWYNADHQSDGTYKVTVQSSRHKNERGLYNVHLYYVLDDGQLKGVGGTQTTLGEQPSINRKLSGTIRIENKRTGEFDVVVSDVYNPNGVREVKLPIWSTVNGQDDIIWYTATRQSDGTYRQHVKASDHKNSSGEYSVHLYYRQNDGTLKGVGGTNTNMEVNHPRINIPSSGVYHFTGYAAIRPEPRVSSAELGHYDVGYSVNYDKVLTADGHTWISYISYAGNRRYIAID